MFFMFIFFGCAHALTFTNNSTELAVDVLVFTKSSNALAYLRSLGWTNKVQGEILSPLGSYALVPYLLTGPVMALSPATWVLFGGGFATRAALKKVLPAYVKENIQYDQSFTIPWQELRKKYKDIEQVRIIVVDHRSTAQLLASGKCGIQANIEFYGIGDMIIYYLFKDNHGNKKLLPEKEGHAQNWGIFAPWEYL